MSSSDIVRGSLRESPAPIGQASVDSPQYSLLSEDNDDIDFEPSADDTDGLEYFETGDENVEDDSDDDSDDEGTEGEYHDAEDGDQDVGIEVLIESSGGLDEEEEEGTESVRVTQPSGAAGAVQVTRAQILRLLGHTGLRRLLAQQGIRGPVLQGDDDEDNSIGLHGIFGSGRPGRRRRKSSQIEYPPVPNPEGRKLMELGTFGQNEHYQDQLRMKKQRVSRILMERELGLKTEQVRRKNQAISQTMIPSSKADTIIHYNSRCYSGQFSDDGNFFFSCAQDFKVRMYDTSNPYDWKYYKTVNYPYGQWTITDATLSPDNRYLAYSSIRSSVCLAATDPGDSSEPWLLDFADLGDGSRRARRHFQGNSHFGIWSVRFSGDGRELVAGTSNSSVYVFDIEANRSILRIPGHSDDVNAVCFGDVSSPHILYSGSDDTLIKVWDRRSMGDSREAGVFMGHTEGVTYVDSKGDGRYVLSNGKDQSMKLWDLRKMMSTDQSATINHSNYSTQFDYRYMTYSDLDYTPHPHDCSLVTYRGHSVLKTLIRCHFSPPGSTNSRYVYSGGEDGKVHVYNLDATLAGTINVSDATFETRPRDSNIYMNAWEDNNSRNNWKTCVRDASWHPNAPVIAATSWNGWGMSTGTCSVHSWSDGAVDDDQEDNVAKRVNHRLETDPSFYDQPTDRQSRRAGLRSRAVGREENDDEHDNW
ncbi:hypothetical protein MMC10_009664 [Thelotrema lepadinum]|nr:hypothetical protein [Thelotrema lepadinum]